MKDIALPDGDDAILARIREVEEYEKVVHRSFEVLEDRFLGDRAAVDALFEAFLDWSPIRAEVIALKLRGDSKVARDITQGKGAAHQAMLEARLDELEALATAKADEFRSQSKALREETIRTTSALLVGLVLLAGLIAWAAARGITVPLEALTEAAERIRRGEVEHRAEVIAQNELGTLARSFKSMVDDLGAMLDIIGRFSADHGTDFNVRVGINSGPVLAGVIGKHKFVYDLWCDTVNFASHMESRGVPRTVHISKTTRDYLQFEGGFETEDRGEIESKGRGSMPTYLLEREVA